MIRTVTLTPTDVPSAANVLAVFRAGTPAHVVNGRGWYGRARNDAREVAAILFQTDDPTPAQVAVAAAIIAVLSPATPWARNVHLARLVATMAVNGATFDEMTAPSAQGGLPCMGANARKAAAIALGADPASVVSGPKVTPFWQRVAEAGTGATGPGSVVIDRHAHDVALGQVTSDKARGLSLGRKGGHHAFAMAYVRAAAVLNRTGEAPGITPSELQAVTWVVWRELFAHAMGKAEARKDAAREVIA